MNVISDDDYCYLTTTGRVTGRPHTIEIWFALVGRTLYLLAGGGERSDWVRNARRQPTVCVRLREQTLAATARTTLPASEDALARRLLFDKYQPRYAGDLTEWARDALPVALDLDDPGEE